MSPMHPKEKLIVIIINLWTSKFRYGSVVSKLVGKFAARLVIKATNFAIVITQTQCFW